MTERERDCCNRKRNIVRWRAHKRVPFVNDMARYLSSLELRGERRGTPRERLIICRVEQVKRWAQSCQSICSRFRSCSFLVALLFISFLCNQCVHIYVRKCLQHHGRIGFGGCRKRAVCQKASNGIRHLVVLRVALRPSLTFCPSLPSSLSLLCRSLVALFANADDRLVGSLEPEDPLHIGVIDSRHIFDMTYHPDEGSSNVEKRYIHHRIVNMPRPNTLGRSGCDTGTSRVNWRSKNPSKSIFSFSFALRLLGTCLNWEYWNEFTPRHFKPEWPTEKSSRKKSAHVNGSLLIRR